MNHSLFDKIIYFFFASWQLNATPWKEIWEEQEKIKIRNHLRFGLLILGFGYLLHYPFVDMPLGLTKDPVWFKYRFGIFSISMLGVLITYIETKKNLLSKIAFIAVGIVISWAQAKSMIWYSGVSGVWAIFITLGISIFYKSDAFVNILLFCVLTIVQVPTFIEINQKFSSDYLSIVFVGGLIFTLILKSRSDDVGNFIRTQKQIQIEHMLTEVQQELSTQIRAFLPSKINSELKKYLRDGYNVTSAIDEVLRPRKKEIACLFSDIRGYTRASKDSGFITNAAMPSIKNANSVIESYGGITRLIGDLIFAYFDDAVSEINIVNSYLAGLEILKSTKVLNSTNDEKNQIIRYVILDIGDAICGNLGGADSSREITALGTPVNRCSRIDQLTKLNEMKLILGNNAIVMSEQYYSRLKTYGYLADFKKIELSDNTLSIKDFENENCIYYTTEILSLCKINTDIICEGAA